MYIYCFVSNELFIFHLVMVMTNESSRLEHTIMILITTVICSIMQYLHYGNALRTTGFSELLVTGRNKRIIYYFYIYHSLCFKDVYCSEFMLIFLWKLICSICFHRIQRTVKNTFKPPCRHTMRKQLHV